MHQQTRSDRRLRIGSTLPVLIITLCLSMAVAACGGSASENGENKDEAAAKADAASESHAARAHSSEGKGGHKHTNRLIDSKSPYLLQHAHNPVDWYPWGEEALAKAKAEDRPIFLSIGYSTCHWCHVMERESFENEEIAALLNQHFVCIKVDREERPDLDHLYMTAVQAMTGRGGWPMTTVLTPDLVPFFAGTYFPPEDRRGQVGMRRLVPGLAKAWETDRDNVLERAAQIRTALLTQAERVVGDAATATIEVALLDQAFEQLKSRFDSANGGFGSKPKFPNPHSLRFLLRYAHRTGNQQAIDMARTTLDAMAKGGIHDHLGGGFHRYSTDDIWLVSHFEKMLYDQAGLALAYTDGWLVTGEPAYEAVTRGILDYVLAYMTHPEGGFYSAEDADSEGEEGKFYVWTVEEIESILGVEAARSFDTVYDVKAGGNWEGKTILNLSSLEPLHAGAERVDQRRRLLAVRDQRVRPHLDDKVVVSWNGFMIEAFAYAGQVLNEPRYLAAAEDAARFIREKLWKDGRLRRHYRDGVAPIGAYLDDYAFLGRGLVALYEATFDPVYLEQAVALAGELDRLFSRPDGAFNLHGSDAEELIVPVIEIYDGAMPSGNSATAVFLLRLGHLTSESEIEDRGWNVLKVFAGAAGTSPSAYLELLSAMDFALGPITELVIAGTESDPVVRSLWQSISTSYMPNTVRIFHPEGEESRRVVELVPFLEAQVAIGGQATAYVCQNYACQLPVHDPAGLVRALGFD